MCVFDPGPAGRFLRRLLILAARRQSDSSQSQAVGECAVTGAVRGPVGHAGARQHASERRPARDGGECLSFAPMQNAVGATPTLVVAVNPPVTRIHDVQAVAAILPRAFDAFRSRAPPAFL